ncbi:phytanoyl-CoA dioxygenase [Xylanibacillus composti]|uniref:Protein involved in biosynthesis of mitomycin antibiotics/polyketide fumonisin n=1 Tax=Xylanibacillus composti TaxID=1572762 RepID=A0A8J4H4B7_9BACL|nr:phytanoyl-CoA dioxygenase family protein [Xylanibacillus composti]MDT9726727.1 phytanoyl-CoA dioxygenase [Xylanibacillus composti]GIQ69341.1 protein involved in biosynthesis of mitomycin antibiotics/polyketide fumonisin [Xylanibacillus composti]
MTKIVSAEDRRFFEENGYVVLRHWVSAEDAQQINQEFHKLWMDLIREGTIVQEEDRPLESVFPRLRDYHFTRPEIAGLILSDDMFAAAEALLGEPALAISTSYYFKGPGTRGLPAHQDNYSVGAAPKTTCSLWTCLSASQPRNGGLYVVPGSHKLGLLEPEPIEESEAEYGEKLSLPEGYEKLPLETNPGDVVALHGNLVHGSYANVTKNRFRQAHVTHFTGTSAERVALNHHALLDRSGSKVRRRLNVRPKAGNPTLKKAVWSGVGGSKPWEGSQDVE